MGTSRRTFLSLSERIQFPSFCCSPSPRLLLCLRRRLSHSPSSRLDQLNLAGALCINANHGSRKSPRPCHLPQPLLPLKHRPRNNCLPGRNGDVSRLEHMLSMRY